ncbi:unnamed protein product, partial [Brugia timori]|uniref:Ovule protein n=1 Tax=Brugia timori TaxID=42155 RepID=A0A0R3R5U4_9BILA
NNYNRFFFGRVPPVIIIFASRGDRFTAFFIKCELKTISSSSICSSPISASSSNEIEQSLPLSISHCSSPLPASSSQECWH